MEIGVMFPHEINAFPPPYNKNTILKCCDSYGPSCIYNEILELPNPNPRTSSDRGGVTNNERKLDW